MPEHDFMPIQDFDHLECYVGDARQAAYYLSHGWGFVPIAYAGLETGVRDHSSYVLEQGNVRFVITSPYGPQGREGAAHQSARRGGQRCRLPRGRCRASLSRSHQSWRTERDGTDGA